MRFRRDKVEKYVVGIRNNVVISILFYPFGTAFAYLLFKILSNSISEESQHLLRIKTWVDILIKFVESHANMIFIGSVIFGIILTNTLLLNRQRRLLEVSGLNFFSEHSSSDRISADWKHLLKEFKNSNTQSLHILGSTGLNTFASPDSPLHNYLENFKGAVFILLIDPESDVVATRAKDLGMKLTDYRAEITESIKYLESYCRKNRTVKLKVYKSMPVWKMIMSDRYLWLQYYEGNQHVDDTTVYGINKNNSSYRSFYQYSHWQFDKLWEHSRRYDLG